MMWESLKRLVGYPDDTANPLTQMPIASSLSLSLSDWLASLPRSIVFIDTETTGLTSQDRIITFGAIRLDTANIASGELALKIMHLIFNPEKQSHPRAEAVHGYSSSILKNQDRFDIHAKDIHEFVHTADLVAAHNASFDLAFLDRELGRAGLQPVAKATYCTMSTYREVSEEKASIDAICSRMGMRRQGNRHGALEDAWLAMNIYLWLNDCPHRADLPIDFDYTPTNFRK